MPTWRSISILIALAAMFIFLLAAGCAGDEQTETIEPDEDEGRAVAPEVDWTLEDVPEADVGEDDDIVEEEDGREDEENGKEKAIEDEESGDEPSEEFPVPGNVDFEVYVDGELLPEGMPLELYPNQHVNLTFHLTATASELARYSITTDTAVTIPKEGELSGYEADVNYQFTYNPDTWREGGIVITVVNKSGNTFMTNVPVYPAPLPGNR